MQPNDDNPGIKRQRVNRGGNSSSRNRRNPYQEVSTSRSGRSRGGAYNAGYGKRDQAFSGDRNDNQGQRGNENRRGNENWRGNENRGGNENRRGIENRRGNENRGGNENGPRVRMFRLGFRKLDEILGKEPDDIIIELLNKNAGFEEFLLTGGKSNDIIVLLVSLAAKACTSKFVSSKTQLLQLFAQPVFLDDLKKYIINLPLQDNREKYGNAYFWKSPDVFFDNLFYISEAYITTIQSTALQILPKIIKTILYTLPNIKGLQDDTINKFESIDTKLTTVESENLIKKTKEYNDHDYEEPPNNFRDINIYPLPEEITAFESPFLRKNIVEGKYNNVDHYLDVQFRLLREDFVAPLREGICNYMKAGSKRPSNIRLYHKVLFVTTQVTRKQIGVMVQFPMGKKQMNFENSRRFMYGSLILFTADNFRTIFFGKVIDRDIKILKNGNIIIGFQEGFTPNFEQEYTMVESTVYFEPYYHVLNALQRMDPQKFPLQKYLIDVEASDETPTYFESDEFKSTFVPEENDYHEANENMNVAYKAVLRNKSFIAGHQIYADQMYLGLNRSQSIAFREALTNKLSIIQGPPGTGKTHLALKVVKTLLQNSSIWNTAPMLIICYTNHALDQFLEGLLDTCKDMIRVGSQSKNEKLTKYNLREQRSSFRRSRASNALVYQLKHEVNATGALINDWTNELNSSVDGTCVVTFENFRNIDPMYANTWFDKAGKQEIIEWLLGGKSDTERDGEAKTYRLIEVEKKLEKVDLQDDEDSSEDEEMINLVNRPEDFLDMDEVDVDEKLPTRTLSNLISLKELKSDIFNVSCRIDTLKPDTIEHYLACMEKQKLLDAVDYFAYRLNEVRFINIQNKPNVDLQSPHTMPAVARWRLYTYWLSCYRKEIKTKIDALDVQYRKCCRQFDEVKCIEDTQLMKSKLIIGMTTTGAARLQTSLQSLKCPIVIVEEAAEVLESHIISALTSDCQHLILIGDHQQLRPSTSNYRIEKEYKLGISLFERMIKNKIQCNVLTVQHRMRPEIARLIVPAIYEHLDNHASVYEYPNITGIAKPLYFIHHNEPELSSPDNSKENDYEAQYLILLARHLILNGYKSEDITILAAYSGQLFNLMRRKRNTPIVQGVRICVLDNYQGEECKIILLSLVRNNKDGTIGFLSIENRVCVALSRAKHGFYIMGNMDILCGNTQPNNPWPKIRPVLESMDAIGNALQVRCEKHPDQINHLKTIKDFEKVPEGGCMQECGEPLDCGHRCISICHIREHKPPVNEEDDLKQTKKKSEEKIDMQIKCYQPCHKISLLCVAHHICPLKCYQECEPCIVPKQTQLKCGHIIDIPCSMSPDMVLCPVKVLTKLECDHEAEKPCHMNPMIFKCPHPCDTRIEPCGHSCTLACHIRNDPDHIAYKCKKKCEKSNANCTDPDNADHRCMLLCSDQCKPCSIPVQKKRTICPHMFKVACSEDVDKVICRKPCKKKMLCAHKCLKQCFDCGDCDCGDCNVKVLKLLSTCGHQVTTKCCDEPKVEHCEGKCPKALPCGHKCIKKCKQTCTTNCREMVDNPYNSSCGHTFKIPCNLTAGKIADLNKLMVYCREKCTKILECGHQCLGSCGECAQGRMHKKCQEKCGITLVCDHECKTPCRSICQPCTEPCTYKCTHSICKQPCGKPCTSCKEPCSRRCEHIECTMKCFQKCNVQPCNFPCTKKNKKCGHDCIGFCGDICPPKCRICDADDVLEVFFGTEDEQDARFIYLIECGHIFESSGLDQWMQQDIVKGSIKIKKCPKCNTTLNVTKRYSDYIKAAYEDINTVKKKFYGNEQQNDQERRKLRLQVEDITKKAKPLIKLSPKTGEVILQFIESLKIVRKDRRQSFFTQLIKTYSSKIQIFEQILDIYLSAKTKNNVLIKLAVDYIDFLFGFMLEQEKMISNQEIKDYSLEMNRLTRIMQFTQIADSCNTALLKQIYDECYELIFIAKSYEENIDTKVVEKLKQFNLQAKTAYVITEREKREIVGALGLSTGHWFKCPNGHVYAIGECGGATETSICPECKEAIGGTSHTLLQSNSLATEMDGATQPAYPTINNMENYML